MAQRGVVYFLPPGPPEDGSGLEDLLPPTRTVRRWRTYFARSVVGVNAVVILLCLAAWIQSRTSVLEEETLFQSSAHFPQLWSWDSIFRPLGVPWLDSSDPRHKDQLRGANRTAGDTAAGRSKDEAGDSEPGNDSAAAAAGGRDRREKPLAGGNGTGRVNGTEGNASRGSTTASPQSLTNSTEPSNHSVTREPAAEKNLSALAPGTLPPSHRPSPPTPPASNGSTPALNSSTPPHSVHPHKEHRNSTTAEPTTTPGSSTTTRTTGTRPPPEPCSPDIKVGMENGIPSCTDQKTCLCIVDQFLQRQPRNPLGLLQTRAGSLGGGNCGVNCTLPHKHRRCDIYDNSLAVIYYIKRGYMAEAKKVLDVLTQLLYPFDPSKVDPALLYDTPSGRKLTLLATAYSNNAKTWAGVYEGKGVAEGTVDTGNNAWAALAFAHYAAAAGAPCYSLIARDILHALKKKGSCDDQFQGIQGRMPPTDNNYRASEHNIDVLALARMLGDTDTMMQASFFVRKMYFEEGPVAHSYRMGAVSCYNTPQPDDGNTPVPADAIYWGLLAGADPNRTHMKASIAFALRDSPALQQPPLPSMSAGAVEPLDACCGPGRSLACCPSNCCFAGPGNPPCCMRRLAPAPQGLWEEDVDVVWKGGAVRPRLNGTRFTTGGHGVQWEVSAGAAMAMIYYIMTFGHDEFISRRLREVQGSLRHLLAMYKGVPASILGGNYDAYAINNHDARFPGGTDTGISFTYLRYRHVASTAWTGLLLLYQAEPDSPVYEDANPFAPPSDPMPSDMDKTCLPWLKGEVEAAPAAGAA